MAKINEMADMKLSNVLGDSHKLNYQNRDLRVIAVRAL